MNHVLLCNRGNDYKLPHVRKLEISAAANGHFPMRFPCRALITGDHLNADATTTAIVANDQGTPAHLFLIVVSFCRCPLSPLIPPSIDRACRRRPSIVRATAVHQSFVPPPSIDCSCRRHPSQSSRRPSIVTPPFIFVDCCHHSTRPSNCCRGPPRPRSRGHRRR
jgi:hypothetical protein